jgi:hypothetical protein
LYLDADTEAVRRGPAFEAVRRGVEALVTLAFEAVAAR